MRKFISYFAGDRVIWIITLIMLAFSILSVYSFVPILIKMEGGTPFKYVIKHTIYVVTGLLLAYWIHQKDPKYFSLLSKLGFYVAIGLLLFTLVFGTKVNDAGRWIRIPFVGLTFQSSDFAKVALIIYLSRLMVKKQAFYNSWKEGFMPILWPIIIICGLIFRDNFSTAAILFCIAMVMLFIGKVPFGKIATVLGVFLLVFGGMIAIQKTVPGIKVLSRLETWENRIFNRLNDEKNIAANAQALNAQLAIYNGGFFGQGVGDGKLKEYIPEAYADFYYASFVEEFGSIAALLLLMMYFILLFRIIKIGLNAENLFETYVCIGIGVLLLTQATVNMLVCTGLFPVTGQNMPLLAMGGSALIMTCASIGIVQSIAAKQMKNATVE